MSHRARNLATWTSMLFALLWLQGCATAPEVLTEVEIREVKVPVRTPLPDDCFTQHQVNAAARLPAEGSLTVKEYVTWADALVVIVKRYQAQSQRCHDLNHRDPAAPSSEP